MFLVCFQGRSWPGGDRLAWSLCFLFFTFSPLILNLLFIIIICCSLAVPVSSLVPKRLMRSLFRLRYCVILLCSSAANSCAKVQTFTVQLITLVLAYVQITSAGLWSHNEPLTEEIDGPDKETSTEIEKSTNVDGNGSPHLAAPSWLSWISSDAKMVKSQLESWKTDNDGLESQREVSISTERFKSASDDVTGKVSKDVPRSRFFASPKESLRAAIFHIGRKWHGRLSFFLRLARRILGGFWVRFMMLSLFRSLSINWLPIASDISGCNTQWLMRAYFLHQIYFAKQFQLNRASFPCRTLLVLIWILIFPSG